MAARHGLILLADLHSRLTGVGLVTGDVPVLRGIITGLERGTTATGPTFDALVEQVARLFSYDPDELRRSHLTSAPVETAIDLDRLAHTLDVPHREEQAAWEPRHLPVVLDYLPEAVPLGLYGRGPNWLYAALALLSAPAPFVQFDVRLGWVRATSLHMGMPDTAAPLQIQSHESPDYVHVEGILPTAYLDYSQLETLAVPPVPAGFGVVLSGKLPHWLYTSLALTYRAAPWIAVYQPQLECAVVVYSADEVHVTGNCIHDVRL
jgi:CRISPR-associated protein Csx3